MSKLDFKYDPEYQRFAAFMGIDPHKRRDIRVAQKLARLYDWGKEKAKSDESDKIMAKIEGFRKDLGVSITGETLVDFLYQRTALDTSKSTEKKKPRTARPKEKPKKKKEAEEPTEPVPEEPTASPPPDQEALGVFQARAEALDVALTKLGEELSAPEG